VDDSKLQKRIFGLHCNEDHLRYPPVGQFLPAFYVVSLIIFIIFPFIKTHKSNLASKVQIFRHTKKLILYLGQKNSNCQLRNLQLFGF